MTYKIVRLFQDERYSPEIVRTGLTITEAKMHCKSPETSSTTCEDGIGKDRTMRCGPWFDTYEEEKS